MRNDSLSPSWQARQVADTVSNGFINTTKMRYEHIVNRITEILKEDESGVLFIREEQTAQFPDELEIFSVMPPSLDDIHRWFREQAAKPTKVAENDKPEKSEVKKGKTKKKKS